MNSITNTTQGILASSAPSPAHEKSQVRKRILKEVQLMREVSKLENISAGPITDDNLFEWWAKIRGPCDTPYEDGIFRLEIHFDETYPRRPMKVRFLTNVYHPNIDTNGNINIDVLKAGWSPVLTASLMLLTISSFLDDPFPDRLSPCYDQALVPEIAELYLKDKETYEKKASEWTEKYAREH